MVTLKTKWHFQYSSFQIILNYEVTHLVNSFKKANYHTYENSIHFVLIAQIY